MSDIYFQYPSSHILGFQFRRTFSRPTVWEDSLVSSTLPNPQTRLGPDIQKHCVIRSDLRHLPKSEFIKERKGLRSYYVADYELIASLRNNNLNLALQYRRKRYGVADVLFETAQASTNET